MPSFDPFRLKPRPLRFFPGSPSFAMPPIAMTASTTGAKKAPIILFGMRPPLKIGDSIMYIFELANFVANESITFTLKSSPAFLKSLSTFFAKSCYITYRLFQANDNTTRLVVKIVANPYPDALHRIMLQTIDFLDYIMMRKQLLTFKKLAENQLVNRSHFQ